MRFLLSLVFFLITLTSQSQGLSADEQNIINEIDNNFKNTLGKLETVVNINSGTNNLIGVKKTGFFFQKEFENLGFKCEWISLPDSLKKAGHLFASRKGKRGKKILLLGHLDTVFELDQPFNSFKIIGDTVATGQGVVDMKGGDIVILSALKALSSLGYLDGAEIGIYLTGDEESGGKPIEVTRQDLISRSKEYEIALSFESGKLNSAVTSRRGSGTWKLKVSGKQSHSSGIFGKKNGYGAIYEAARILESIRLFSNSEKYLTISPGVIAGGTTVIKNDENLEVFGKDNVIASNTLISGDYRFISEKQKNLAKEKIQQIISSGNLSGTSAEITFSDGIPPMEKKRGNLKLLEQLNQVNLDLGGTAVKSGDPGKRGAGDISFIAKYVDCLDGLGATGKGAHTPNEILKLKEYPFVIKRVAILLYRLINKED